ncbi:hypothetical protein HK103_007277 [Boothiomyces macroporosus]|uniref:C2H2-type domain-containing protein n=1 Tax=Boothiomyces macroporosus TaxID=261099 RepID=A0AAD5Y6F8_9FUNG|nr:hypothetical protein HK103_007277 [Boothiomyces macroporosus]
MPSPSTNLYERSMSALLSTFKGSVEEQPTSAYSNHTDYEYQHNVPAVRDVGPTVDYIVGSFLDSMDTMQPQSQHTQQPVSYDKNMLLLDNMEGQQRIGELENNYMYPSMPKMENYEMTSAYQMNRTASYSGENSDPIVDGIHRVQSADGMKRMSVTSQSSPMINRLNHSDSLLSMPSNEPQEYRYPPEYMSTYYNGYQIPNQQMNLPYLSNSSSPYVQGSVTTSPTQTVYECDFPDCKKTYSKLTSLESHKNSHLNPNAEKSKPFVCDKCPQAFSRSHDLKRHQYIHSQSKPFTCNRCGRGFSRRDALKRHEKSLAEGKKVHCIALTSNEAPVYDYQA